MKERLFVYLTPLFSSFFPPSLGVERRRRTKKKEEERKEGRKEGGRSVNQSGDGGRKKGEMEPKEPVNAPLKREREREEGGRKRERDRDRERERNMIGKTRRANKTKIISFFLREKMEALNSFFFGCAELNAFLSACASGKKAPEKKMPPPFPFLPCNHYCKQGWREGRNFSGPNLVQGERRECSSSFLPCCSCYFHSTVALAVRGRKGGRKEGRKEGKATTSAALELEGTSDGSLAFGGKEWRRKKVEEEAASKRKRRRRRKKDKPGTHDVTKRHPWPPPPLRRSAELPIASQTCFYSLSLPLPCRSTVIQSAKQLVG